MSVLYHKKSIFGLLSVFAYIFTILAANWSIQHLGFCSDNGPCVVPVWPNLYAPSGVLWAGLAFSLRDFVQDTLGRRWAVGAILAGALLSALISGPLALASGVAFLASELCDFAIYTPLRERNKMLAVLLSNTVGAVVDSAIFLFLAFGSLEFIAGQILGKSWMTLLAVALLFVFGSARAPQGEA